jgi:hypothetical protein
MKPVLLVKTQCPYCHHDFLVDRHDVVDDGDGDGDEMSTQVEDPYAAARFPPRSQVYYWGLEELTDSSSANYVAGSDGSSCLEDAPPNWYTWESLSDLSLSIDDIAGCDGSSCSGNAILIGSNSVDARSVPAEIGPPMRSVRPRFVVTVVVFAVVLLLYYLLQLYAFLNCRPREEEALESPGHPGAFKTWYDCVVLSFPSGTA